MNALRKYGIKDIVIDGDENCQHEWGNKSITLKHKSNETNPGKEAYFKNNGASEDIGNQFCIHCKAWQGQYGLEPAPTLFIEHTRLWAKEAWRVLRDDGIFFLNLADSYPSGGGKAVEQSAKRQSAIDSGAYPDYSPSAKLRQSMPKCQLLIPHRVAIALVDDGWTLRNTIVWHKPNAMPESVTDRFSKKYEYIFMFAKQGKYYFDLDAVKEKANMLTQRGKPVNATMAIGNTSSGDRRINYEKNRHKVEFKNPGDVWSIPTSPSPEKHYAMWPERLVERMIKCSTKAGDIVLDPFCGSATTLKVAKELGRIGIGIDLGYHEMSKRRTAKIQKKMFV